MSAHALKSELLEESNDVVETTAQEVLPFPEPIKIYPNSNLREQYLKEKEEIEKEYGTLEDMRLKLGLSRRKICQLLLVDPSAWTRWTKSKEGAPPHVYQSLKWYMKLNSQPETEQNIHSKEELKSAQQDQEHIPMVLEAKMLQISTVYERQLSKISQEIENLKNTLVVKEDIAQSVRNTVSDTISAQIAIHMSRIQPQQQTQVQPQVVVQPDPRAEQLRYENARYQNQVQSLEDSLRAMKHEMELLKKQTQKKSKKKIEDDDLFADEPSGESVTNKFMAGTLILLALGGLLYTFIKYG